MAAQKSARPTSFASLLALLGKPKDDPAVVALVAATGAKVSADFIEARTYGFDFSLEHPPTGKKKVLAGLYLFRDKVDKHVGFADLPKPFVFGDRAAVRKGNQPDAGWTLDDGDVAPDHPESERDSWKRDGYEIMANYRGDGLVGHYYIELGEEARGGRDLSTHPLHFETSPVDAPPDAALVGMALIVAWSADRFGLPAKHAGTPAGKQLAAKQLSPVAFLKTACASTLTTLDIDPALGDFCFGYTQRMFIGTRAPNRAKTDQELAKLLNLPHKDERAYDDDFLGTFKRVVKNPFYVPDDWAAVARMGAILDARWADFQATQFKAPPDLAIYKTAVKARDGVTITPATAATAKLATTDDLAKQLIALIGKPIKEAKPVLESAGLPIGKTIDEQANPAAGISYMGSKLEIAGKRVLCVTAVDFYAANQTSYIRGLGKEVEFGAFTNEIVLGVKIGDARADVAKKLGKPKGTSDERDYWYPDKEHMISAAFGKRSKKLVSIHFGFQPDWSETKVTAPFGPKGVF